VPQEVCGVSKINPVKKTRPAIKNWCFKPEGPTPKPPPTPTKQCPPNHFLNDDNECEKEPDSGQTLLEQIVFFGFSSNPSGVNTTTMLIGKDVKDGTPECQFSKTITAGHIDTVNNILRVNMEGVEDLGDYEDGECYQAPLDGELSGKFGSVTVTADKKVDWDGVKMCLDWDISKDYEWICELSSPTFVPGVGEKYSIDCKKDDARKCEPFL
jgi:hypothetical protein